MVQSPAEYMSHLGIIWIMIQFSDWTWCFWLEASWSHQWWQWWGSFHAIRGSPRRTWSNRSLASVMREALSTESFSYSWKWLENQLIKTGKDMRETRPRRRESLLEECPQKTEGKPSRNLGVKVEDIPVPDWLTRGCVCVWMCLDGLFEQGKLMRLFLLLCEHIHDWPCSHPHVGHGQYLLSSWMSSIFEECIIVFQVLGYHVRIPCIFHGILMVKSNESNTSSHFHVERNLFFQSLESEVSLLLYAAVRGAAFTRILQSSLSI